jgi:hypothetical protein
MKKMRTPSNSQCHLTGRVKSPREIRSYWHAASDRLVVPGVVGKIRFFLILCLASVLGSWVVCADGAGRLELVMQKGDRILATTEAGRIEVTAGDGLHRSYRWEGAERSVELWPRVKRWYGSMGAYYPGPGEHWEEHHGITRGVLQEGQQHFDDLGAAKDWLVQQGKWYPTVFTDSGLVVSFSKVMGRRQIRVEVWQITINGKFPEKLQGADNSRVQFLKSKAQRGSP